MPQGVPTPMEYPNEKEYRIEIVVEEDVQVQIRVQV